MVLQFTTYSQNIHHLNQCTYEHVWPWDATFERSPGYFHVFLQTQKNHW